MSIREDGTPIKWHKQALEDLCNELIEYVSRPGVYTLTEFTCVHKKMTQSWLHKVAEHHPVVAKAMDTARGILASKLVKEAVHGNSNAYVMSHYMPLYDKYVKAERTKDRAEQFEFQCQLERFKHELGKSTEEQAGAKIDQFDKSQELAAELVRLRNFLKYSDLEEDFDQYKNDTCKSR